MLNIATVNAIYEAVYLGKPLVHRVVTVTGNGVNKPGNFDVPLGISAKYLAEQAGGIKDETVKLISGGPMMGFALSSLDVPVTKTYSSILALTEDDVEKMKTTACLWLPPQMQMITSVLKSSAVWNVLSAVAAHMFARQKGNLHSHSNLQNHK